MGSQNANSAGHFAPHTEPDGAGSPTIFEADLVHLKIRFPLKRFITLIVAIGALVIAMIAYSAETGLRMSQRYTPLIDAAMEIKLEATTAYLWYEEVIGQDPHANMDLVRQHID